MDNIFTDEAGEARTMHAGDMPWHRKGWHFLKAFLSGAMFEKDDQGRGGIFHDYHITTQAVQTDNGIIVPGYKATMWGKRPLAIVGEDYPVVQVRECVAHMEALMQDAVMKFDACGILGNGEAWWVVANIPTWEGQEITPGDKVYPYLMSYGSFDGSKRHHYLPILNRAICQNTINLALMGMKGVREFSGILHRGDMTAKMQKRNDIMAPMFKGFNFYADSMRQLAGVKWNTTPGGKEQAKKYITTLWPEVKADGRAKTIRDNAVAQVKENLTNPRNVMHAGNWWGLTNAVTEFIDHQKGGYKGETDDARLDNKFKSTLMGDGAEFKARATNLALEMAGLQPLSAMSVED